jgi:hypothetical protein
MDWFLVDVRVMKRCGRWGHGCWGIHLPRRIWRSDSIAWSLSGADAFYGCGEAVGCLKDAICGRYFSNGNGMVFVAERVCDTFATYVMHDDLDALIMLEGRADVPRVQWVKTPYYNRQLGL